VEAALRALPGVASAEVALLSQQAIVRCAPGACSQEAVVEAVEGCGFEARVLSSSSGGGQRGPGAPGSGGATVKLRVGGMHCGACSSGGACCRRRCRCRCVQRLCRRCYGSMQFFTSTNG
jgi:Cu+-exporting ATPase